MKLLLGFLFTVTILVACAFAQDPAAAALPSDIGLLGLSTNTQLHIMMAGVAFKYLSELYSAIRNGGGLKRIIFGFWLGEQTPKVIADDYKVELSTPPFPPKAPAP